MATSIFLQKINNSDNSDISHFKLGSPFVWLFGLSSSKDNVYLEPAIIQIWALIYLIVGLTAASLWGSEGVKKATIFIYIGGSVVLAIIGWIFIILEKKGWTTNCEAGRMAV